MRRNELDDKIPFRLSRFVDWAGFGDYLLSEYPGFTVLRPNRPGTNMFYVFE
jgi:hypothetical protein